MLLFINFVVFFHNGTSLLGFSTVYQYELTEYCQLRIDLLKKVRMLLFLVYLKLGSNKYPPA